MKHGCTRIRKTCEHQISMGSPRRSSILFSTTRYRHRGMDDTLVRVAPLLELAPNWRALLARVVGEEDAKRLRSHGHAGRPLGSLGRSFWPRLNRSSAEYCDGRNQGRRERLGVEYGTSGTPPGSLPSPPCHLGFRPTKGQSKIALSLLLVSRSLRLRFPDFTSIRETVSPKSRIPKNLAAFPCRSRPSRLRSASGKLQLL
jgi:hypothetical protein